MANQEHLNLLKQGVEVWNQWRKEHQDIQPDLYRADLNGTQLIEADLSGADLSHANLFRANLLEANLTKADLSNANFREANLTKADLSGANFIYTGLSEADLGFTDLSSATLIHANLCQANLNEAYLSGANLNKADLSSANLNKAYLGFTDLREADLTRADLSEADLSEVDLSEADLSEADLSRANLSRANLLEANLWGADLSHANLSRATFVETDFTNATLSNCRVYGAADWKVKLQKTKQENLVITPDEEAIITVDTLEVAQFIYLLLNNQKIRDVIDTLTTKAVLILGRFTPKRKTILDAIKDELRKHNYLPILFDFEKPANRDFTETVSTLAHLARFVIADLTDAKSIPQELQAIIPTLAVPIQPLLLSKRNAYAMFKDFQKYQWVLSPYYYTDQANLLATLKENVIKPAEQKAKELAQQTRRKQNQPDEKSS